MTTQHSAVQNENKFSAPLQDAFIAMLVCGTAENVRELVSKISSSNFDTDYADIAALSIEYFQNFGVTPGLNHAPQVLFTDNQADHTRRLHILGMIERMDVDGLNEEFLLTQVTKFKRKGNTKRLTLTLAHLVQNKGDDAVDDAERLICEAAEQIRKEPVDGLGAWIASADNNAIPRRQWLLGKSFCRKAVSSLIAAGGTGKSALRMAQALAMASGKNLTDEWVFGLSRVLYVSGEDDEDELRRRVRAAMIHHEIKPEDIGDRLVLATSSRLKLAIENERGKIVPGDLLGRLKQEIDKHNIDVVILDPLIKFHGVKENDTVMDEVMTLLSELASEENIAIDIPHHTRKGTADPGNADGGRGSSAIVNAVRLCYSLFKMTDGDAQRLGVSEEERLSLVRMDSAKVNLAPASAARWYKLVGVELNNGDRYVEGDNVQTMEVWKPRDLFEDVTDERLRTIFERIHQGLPNGQRYTNHYNAKTRGAWVIVQEILPNKTKEQARQIIDEYLKSGDLVERKYRNEAKGGDEYGLYWPEADTMKPAAE